jgi:hypothetical protein
VAVLERESVEAIMLRSGFDGWETTRMITRNQFLKWLGAGAALTACGGGGEGKPDAPPAGACTVTNATVMIETNHPHGMHTLVVSKEDVTAAVDKTYDIMGAATHTHSITITAANFAAVKTAPITVTSTDGGGHTHVVMVSC